MHHASTFVSCRARLCSFIESTNRRGLSYKVALNHMADWHDEEFKMLRGSYSPRPAVRHCRAGLGERVHSPCAL